MLVAFALKNHACFRDRQELSMEATTTSDDTFAFDTGVRRAPRLHRSSVIYGANGSGKSRLLQGLAYARSFVAGSSKDRHAGEEIDCVPFLFDSESRTQPTTFEVSFIEDGIAFEYGFAVDRHRVHEEWLFAWHPGGRMRTLLERRYDAETDNEEWRFGSSVRGPKELWRASTRPNALLASVAAQLNSESFQPVVTWFQKLIVLPSGDIGPGYTMSVSNDEQGKQRVLDLLRDADISVSDIMMRQEEVSLKELKQHLPPRLLQEFADRGRSTVNSVSTSLLHPVAGTGGREPLDLNEESEGTQRMFSFAGVWLEILENNRVAVVDELDLSLHPLLVAALVRRVNSAGAPGADKRAQLVATVHDVTLLGNTVSRGQVWFTEKDQSSEAARLTPLSDYHPRSKEAVSRGYLGGRYGGVPVIKDG